MEVRLWMNIELEELHDRIKKIERQKNDDVLTLVEILANITFFGELKKAQCEYARNGQCSFFILLNEAKSNVPIASNCCVKQCKEATPHCHLELSDITCAFCAIGKNQLKESNSQLKKKTRIQNYEKNLRY
jgi:hypothetical protein